MSSATIYLGISQDRYDAGVALTDGSRVLYAANEERFTRRKNQGGFPARALASAFQYTGVRPGDVTRICVAGITTPPLVGRAFPRLQAWLFGDELPARPSVRNVLLDTLAFRTPLAHLSEAGPLRRVTEALLPIAVRHTLSGALRRAPLAFVEHHRAHAAVAWRLAGFTTGLCITADGMGDGLSMTVNRCDGERIERLWSATSRDSFGLFYEMVTEALGFIPNRHEGKVTGLAASGDATRIGTPCPFELHDGTLIYHGPHGRRGVRWVREHLTSRHRREDIASWTQEIVERHVVAIVRTWLQRTGSRQVAVAGGLFANVKLNQRLHELDEVETLFVCPNMGDGGLSLGAICAEHGLDHEPLAHVFWGEGFAEPRLRQALQQRAVPYEQPPDIDESVAALLARGHTVARFHGSMEWGPRALGNRSILAPTTDVELVGRLNTRLGRSEFMPFAPAVLSEAADVYFAGLGSARHAAQFMTACFDATPRMVTGHPAVVHVDGTVRPQLVDARTNPSFHRLLSAYARRTGSPLLLNTSFNRHEEPIVRTPEQALEAFLAAKLDYLALGPFLVPGMHQRHAAT
jgi:carbamoyltransferase